MVKKVQLKNGLNVLMNTQKKSPVVSVQVWVANGSANESEDVAGVSHFIEHLLFKGTKHFGPGEIAQTIEGSGGQLNAYTSFDQTVYYVTLGKSELSTGLKTLSDMIYHPRFEADEIDKEREVVIEEIRRGLDESSRMSSQFAFKNFFSDHPYSRPIIGYEPIIANIKPEEIKNYFKNYYHPENMFLLVTGDFDESTAEKEIEKYFDVHVPSSFKQKTLPEIKKPKIAESFYQKTEFEDTFINLYWPGADLTSKDYISLEILALILGQGESSYFYKSLKLKQNLVKSVGCYAYSLKQPGVFAFNIKPISGKEIESLKAFYIEMNAVLKEGLKLEDFDKALTNFKSDIYYSLETCDGLARQIGQQYFYMEDENYTEKYLDLLDEMKLEDVQNVFEKYVLHALPKLMVSSPVSDKISKELDVVFHENVNSKIKLSKNENPAQLNSLVWNKTKSFDGKIQEYKLDSGARIYLKAQNETPVVHMDLAFLGGEKIDSSRGVNTTFAQRCWARETLSLSEDQLLFEFDNKASYHTAFSGKHSLGMQMTTLSPYFDSLLNINFDFLQKTKLADEILERELVLLKQQFKNRKDNPAQIAFVEFMKALFGEHFYSQDHLEMISKLENISSKELSQFLESHYDPKNLIISVVGDINPEDIVRKIEGKLKDLKTTTTKVHFQPLKLQTKESFSVIESEKEQAHIVFGFEGLNYKDPRKGILSVIQSILSGQGGRLFLELRDKESLAYTVSPVRMEGQESGYFGSYIACAPSKKEKAIQMMKSEFEKLATILVSDKELESAKKSLIGRVEISLQKNSQISERILFDSLYGLEFNNYLDFKKKINKVSAQDIRQLMAELYNQPHHISVVG